MISGEKLSPEERAANEFSSKKRGLRKKIAEISNTIGARYLEVLHHEPDSVIFQAAIVSLETYNAELSSLLRDYALLQGYREPSK